MCKNRHVPICKGLKDAINKKWNIDSVPNDSKIPQMYVQDVKNNYVLTDNIPQSTDDVNTKAEPATSFVNEDGTHRQ